MNGLLRAGQTVKLQVNVNNGENIMELVLQLRTF